MIRPITDDAKEYLNKCMCNSCKPEEVLLTHKIVMGIITEKNGDKFDWDEERPKLEKTPHPYYDFNPEGARQCGKRKKLL